jgi:hypothetical protein
VRYSTINIVNSRWENELKKITMVGAFVIAALAMGCASKRPSASFTFPEIGSVATKGVGENLLMQGTGQLVQDLVVPQDEVIGAFTLRKGIYPFEAENSKRIKFKREGQDVYFLKADNTICVDGDKKEQCSAIQYSLITKLSKKSANSFQRTLLYNGKIGSRITLAYREFNDDMARAAFSNEVAYDLSESMILGYKGSRIEIIKATNTEITYKVLSGFE